MATASKRKETDVIKLMMKDFKVDMPHDDMSQFYVEFHGPNESPYEGGVWRMRVDMPHTYPYDPPLVTFANMIYHPNVDQMIGAICLDVIKQSWTPAFDLVNVFEAFLPQLLLYPNPSDPLNKEAADLMMRDPPSYDAKVKEYCQRYAKPAEIVPPKDSDADELTEDEDSGDDQSASTSDPK